MSFVQRLIAIYPAILHDINTSQPALLMRTRQITPSQNTRKNKYTNKQVDELLRRLCSLFLEFKFRRNWRNVLLNIEMRDFFSIGNVSSIFYIANKWSNFSYCKAIILNQYIVRGGIESHVPVLYSINFVQNRTLKLYRNELFICKIWRSDWPCSSYTRTNINTKAYLFR